MSRVTEKTRRLILDHAKELFMSNGIGQTYMEDIALKSGKTRRTLYRYFATKDELAFEVVLEILEEFNDYQRGIVSRLSGKGISRLECFLHQLKVYMSERVEIISFMTAFDYYFDDSKIKAISNDVEKRFVNASQVSEGLIKRIIITGVKDRSIKEVDHIDLIVATISNVLWAFAQRAAVRGKTIFMENHLEPLGMISCQIDMYIAYLRKEN